MQNRPETKVYAGFFVRLAAYIIDSLIVGVALLLVRLAFWVSSWINPDNVLVRDFIFQYSAADILLYILGASYFIVMTYHAGATIGKRLLHIQVISAEERDMTLFEVIFRETVGKYLSALILQVGFLMIAVQKEKRGLHDLLSDTEVVYAFKKSVDAKVPVYTMPEPQAYVYAPTEYVTPQAEEVPEEDVSKETE